MCGGLQCYNCAWNLRKQFLSLVKWIEAFFFVQNSLVWPQQHSPLHFGSCDFSSASGQLSLSQGVASEWLSHKVSHIQSLLEVMPPLFPCLQVQISSVPPPLEALSVDGQAIYLLEGCCYPRGTPSRHYKQPRIHSQIWPSGSTFWRFACPVDAGRKVELVHATHALVLFSMDLWLLYPYMTFCLFVLLWTSEASPTPMKSHAIVKTLVSSQLVTTMRLSEITKIIGYHLRFDIMNLEVMTGHLGNRLNLIVHLLQSCEIRDGIGLV